MVIDGGIFNKKPALVFVQARVVLKMLKNFPSSKA